MICFALNPYLAKHKLCKPQALSAAKDCQGNCLAVCLQATADSAALQPPSRGDGSSTSSSRSSFQSVERSSGSGDAVYIKSPVAGGVLEYPGRSVVVLGDVPAGGTSSRGECMTPAVVCASCIACVDVGPLSRCARRMWSL